ncbi:MAG: hypothetical protein NT027_09720 [Proteobacteria bacterium]|nr:hypothetical protein [Pseudomonadota bacterium]
MNQNQSSHFVTIELGDRSLPTKRKLSMTRKQFEVLLVVLPAIVVWGLFSTCLLSYVIVINPSLFVRKADSANVMIKDAPALIQAPSAGAAKTRTLNDVSVIPRETQRDAIPSPKTERSPLPEVSVSSSMLSTREFAKTDRDVRVHASKNRDAGEVSLQSSARPAEVSGLPSNATMLGPINFPISDRMYVSGRLLKIGDDKIVGQITLKNLSFEHQSGVFWIKLVGRDTDGRDFDLKSNPDLVLNELGQAADKTSGLRFSVRHEVVKQVQFPLNQVKMAVLTSMWIGITDRAGEQFVVKHDF